MKLALFFLAASLSAQVPTDRIYHHAALNGIPVYIAVNLLQSESGNRNDQNNPNGWGYWQLNPKWHGYFQWKYNNFERFSEFDPESSTRIALRYLSDLHRTKGTWRKALYAYKCGPNARIVPRRIVDSVNWILEGV